MSEWSVPAVINRVVDGDTVYVTLDLGWNISLYVSVRIVGIDTPELPSEAGKAAKARAMALLPVGLVVTVISHKLDKYGRTLGTVILPDNASFGEILIREGYAVAAPW